MRGILSYPKRNYGPRFMYCRKCGAKTVAGCGGHQRICPNCDVILEEDCLHTNTDYKVLPKKYRDKEE